MTSITFVSITIVPLIFIVGGFFCWRNTKEIAALVFSIGFIPTLVGAAQFWVGPGSFVTLGGDFQVPNEDYMQLASILGYLSSIGNVISALAFLVLVWRFSKYERPSI